GQAPSASTVASSTASSPSVPPSGGGTVHDRVPVGRFPAAPRKIRDRTPNLSAKIRGTATHAGVLIFDVTIGASGEVTRVALARPTDSNAPWPALVEQWRFALVEWRYEPTILENKPVAVCMTVTVTVHVT